LFSSVFLTVFSVIPLNPVLPTQEMKLLATTSFPIHHTHTHTHIHSNATVQTLRTSNNFVRESKHQ